MKKVVLMLLFVYILICATWSKQRQRTLDLVSSMPENNGEIYFKTTPTIAIDESGLVYAIDNRLSELYVFNPITRIGKVLARQGQGPGELINPTHVAADENRVIVRDSSGISIYDKEGTFENRFRLYHLVIDIAVDDNKIYIARAGSPELIAVYDLKGNEIFSFGTKYSVDYDLYKEWSTQLTESVINRGRILFSPDAIYYVSTLFADVFTYDRNGRFISRKKLVPKDLTAQIENKFFLIGLKDKKKGGYGFFCDVAYFDGSFYGLARRNIYINSPGDIIKINIKDNKIDETYKFRDEDSIKNWRLMNMCIRNGENGKPQFYLSYYDDKLSEFKISIFQEREEN